MTSKSRSTSEDTFAKKSLANCNHLNIGAIYCCIIFVSSFVLNSFVLLICYKNKLQHKATNLYLILLILSNLLGTLTFLPFWIISNFECK